MTLRGWRIPWMRIMRSAVLLGPGTAHAWHIRRSASRSSGHEERLPCEYEERMQERGADPRSGGGRAAAR